MKNIVSWLIFLLILVAIIVFSDNLYKNQRCKNVSITIETNGDGKFISKTEIINLLNEKGNNPILGTKFNKLNFANIERKVLANKLIMSCQVSRTLGGELLVKIVQKNPIARIISSNNSSESFNGYYLDEVGGLFPLSKNYTKRVILISGEYLQGKKNLKATKDKGIIEFIKQINESPFWTANITHIVLEKDQNAIIYPLIGDYTIEYGIPKKEEFEIKMNKLKLFYKNIEPQKQDSYKMVSLRFSNQIVCQLKDTTALKAEI